MDREGLSKDKMREETDETKNDREDKTVEVADENVCCYKF